MMSEYEIKNIKTRKEFNIMLGQVTNELESILKNNILDGDNREKSDVKIGLCYESMIHSIITLKRNYSDLIEKGHELNFIE